jgi:hypothetical protein
MIFYKEFDAKKVRVHNHHISVSLIFLITDWLKNNIGLFAEVYSKLKH